MLLHDLHHYVMVNEHGEAALRRNIDPVQLKSANGMLEHSQCMVRSSNAQRA